MERHAVNRRDTRFKAKVKATIERAFKHLERNPHVDINRLIKADMKSMLRRFNAEEERRPKFDYFGQIMNEVSEMFDQGRTVNRPNDWVLGKDGRYVWDEHVTSADDIHLLGRSYIGKSLLDVEEDFTERNSFFSRYLGAKKGGYQAHTDIQSYYESRIPMAVEDVFGRHKWEYNLRRNNDSRTQSPLFKENNVNNDLNIILKGHNAEVEGTICLDDVELKYVANLNSYAPTAKGLFLKTYHDVHPNGKSTLSTYFGGGTLKGKYLAITNKEVGTDIPVLSISFPNDDDYKFAKSWFLTYGGL